MSARCYKCGGPTQPAALNPKALWCTICAEELNQSGGPLTVGEAPPLAVTKGEPVEPTSLSPHPFTEPIASLKQFRVTIGSVAFTATGKTELSVGKSKILIEPL